jgi:uncharacterized membrane protein
MAENPYAAPRSYVADAPPAFPDGEFLPGGRGVSAGNGWKWIADAWAFTAEQRWTFVGIFVLLVLIQIAANFVPIIGPIAVSLVSVVFVGGILLGCDAVRQGGQIEVGHLFAGFQRHAGKLLALGAIWFGAGIVMMLVMVMIVGPSIFPMFFGGEAPSPEQFAGVALSFLLAVLVVLALSVPVSMAMLFAPALIVFREADVGAALKASFGACLKNILPFLIWGVAMLVLSFIASIPLFLGWLLLGPIFMVSLYLSYRDVFHEI